MTDAEREQRITQAYELMCNATTEYLQRLYFEDNVQPRATAQRGADIEDGGGAAD